MNPKDVDFESLINFHIYEKNEKLIKEKFRLKGAKAHYDNLDAYTVKVYPDDHERSGAHPNHNHLKWYYLSLLQKAFFPQNYQHPIILQSIFLMRNSRHLSAL